MKIQKASQGVWIITEKKSILLYNQKYWIDTAKNVLKEIARLERICLPPSFFKELKIEIDGIGKGRMVLRRNETEGICVGEKDNVVAFAKAFIDFNQKKPDQKIWLG